MKSKWIRILLLLVAGVIMCYWQIYLPLRDAQLYAPSISYSYKGVIIGPISLIAGIILCFAPHDYDWKQRKLIQEEKRHTYFNVLLLVIVLLTAVGTIYWFKHCLAQLGYQ